MRKLTYWMAGTLLFAAPQVVLAQHGSHGTKGASGANAGSYPRETDSDIKDIQKMFALQATAEQKSQFQAWSQNTEAVKQRLHALSLAGATDDFPGQHVESID